MFIMKLLLCLLPLTQAYITINIQVSKSTTDSSIQTTGVSHSLISPNDEKLFNLTNQTLKAAVLKLTGKTPTNVYLKGPTPWNDLYRTYGWEQVKTVIKPHKTKVLKIETTNVVLNKRETVNEDSVERNQEITVTAKVENKVECAWDESVVKPIEIKYNIDVNGLGTTKFEFNSSLGENVKENKIVPFKSASVEVALKPKAVTTAVLTATKMKVTVEIEYLITLDGHVASNNEVKLNDHHFWAYDVKKVLKAGLIPDTKKTKALITVVFYIDEHIVVS